MTRPELESQRLILATLRTLSDLGIGPKSAELNQSKCLPVAAASDQIPTCFTYSPGDDDGMDNAAHAKRLREWANEFRRVAETIAEENTKHSFLELARSYDELAKAEEALVHDSK